jgi:transposase
MVQLVRLAPAKARSAGAPCAVWNSTLAAITAATHKLARLVYTQLKHGTDYVAQEMAAYEAQYRERKKAVTRRAQDLGFAFVLAAAAGG